MSFRTVIGYVGAVSLALCALPLLLATVRDGHANGVDPVFLALWLGGEVAMLWHVLLVGATLPVKLNYIANSLMVSVVGWYRFL